MTDVERIEKAIKSLNDKIDLLINKIDNGKKKKQEQNIQLTQFQKAVKVATAKNSTDEAVKNALNTFVESSEQLTPSQFAFCIYFLWINKKHLSDDISWFIGIQIGKHKYNQRDQFIESVQKVLDEKYKNNQNMVSQIKIYLDTLKRK